MSDLRGFGPHKVRSLLQAGYFNGDEVLDAEEWLESLERIRLDDSNRPNLLVASSAKKAAWIAAIAAIVAAIISTVAAVITYLAWLYPRH